MRDGVASLGGQRDTIRREWSRKAAPALSQIDTIWENYQVAQNLLASSEQVDAQRPFMLKKPLTNIDRHQRD